MPVISEVVPLILPSQSDPAASPGHNPANLVQKLPFRVIATNTTAFALAFAAWVIFGPSVRFIAKEMHFSLPVATLIKTLPILIGAVARIPVGILADRLGSRGVFPLLLLVSGAGVYSASLAHTSSQLIFLSLVMGLCGATFVAGVQSVSSWTAKEQRGLALGIFGSGNVGTALTTFGFPLLLGALGWRGSFRVYAVVLVATGLAYWLLIRNAPRSAVTPTLRASLAPLKDLRTWRFGLYYTATFGVFVATTLTITDIYIDGYHLSVKTAGLLATTFTFSASLIRSVGGQLADKLGARKVCQRSLLTVGLALIPVAFGAPLYVTVTLVLVAGLAMGIGSAAIFRYIPDYYPQAVGAVGGVVGALGGLGGFFLPQISSLAKALTDSTFMQVLPLSAMALLAALTQHFAVARMNMGGTAAETTAHSNSSH